MKIVHVCTFGTYTDSFSYQENVLPRYHADMGHDVTVIAQNKAFDYSGKIVDFDEQKYTDEYGVQIIRVCYKKYIFKTITDVFSYARIFKYLKTINPDLIFVHDAQLTTLTYFDIRKYCNRINPSCIVFGDVHADIYNTSPNKKNIFKKSFLHFYKYLFFKKVIPIYKKIYCVAQSCLEYAEAVLKIPSEKLDLLPLGFDDKLLICKDRDSIRHSLRTKYHLADDDIIVVHGGKLDSKKKTIELIQAISNIGNKKIKLFIFGGVSECYFNELFAAIEKNDFVYYFGPLKPSEYYDLYLSSDIAVFPGGQSAIWQEAIGCGLPLVVYYRNGMTEYLNRCGNAAFFCNQDVDSIKLKLIELLNYNCLRQMKDAAAKASSFFSYKNSARRIMNDYYYFKR